MKANIEKYIHWIRNLTLKFLKKYFSYDSHISAFFLEQYQRGLRVFFMVGVVSYSAYAIFDYMQGFYLLLILRLIIIILCILPILVYLKKLGFAKMKYISNLFLYLILILEMETQMQATEVPFFHSSTWFVDILIILIHALYFQGTPKQYSLYWLTLILYYCSRSFLKVDREINPVIINVWMYHFEAWLFGSVFNFWWFKIRYERTLADIRLKEEYEKRISIEKELSRIKEREAIFADIHDSLGGKLLDLSLQLNNLETEMQIPLQFKSKIDKTLSEVLKGLRNRLLVYDDIQKIEKNFSEGLELFLVRRYSLADRKIQLSFAPFFCDNSIPKEKVPLLINVITELVNNDLKYGFGVSKWSINSNQKFLSFHMLANTNWNSLLNQTRNGHLTIRKRIDILNAVFMEEVNGSLYSFYLSIPTNDD